MRRRLTMIPLTWNSGRTSRTRSRPDPEPIARCRHRGDVGVIEHHALGPAGGAARVDEQRQSVETRAVAHRDRAPARRPDARRLRRVGNTVRARRSVTTNRWPGIGQLVHHLVVGQCRIDRRQRCAQVPGGEHDRNEFRSVSQHCGDHIAGPDADLREAERDSLDLHTERSVVEYVVSVFQRRRTGPPVDERDLRWVLKSGAGHVVQLWNCAARAAYASRAASAASRPSVGENNSTRSTPASR